MSEFLLEIFSEEIPATFQSLAQAQLAHRFETRLKKESVNFEGMKVFGTPRRLGLVITGLPSVQQDHFEERRGPRADAPEAAIEGFLKSINKQRHECVEKYVGDKGPFLFATLHAHGKPTCELLGDIIQDIVANFEWPKSMRWKTDTFTWARPLHSILALFEGQVVPLTIESLNIKACSYTFGHRFLAPHKINVKNYADYKLQLAEHYVQIDPAERQSSIQEQIQPLLRKKNLSLETDRDLLEETANLVEWPVVLMGSIDEKFTTLPEEVLITSMKTHQRYFATRDQNGKLSPYFLIVSNMESCDQGAQIIEGNERVLRARLSDAHFFWAQDMKRSLIDWNAPLKHRIFQEKLGTLADKIARMQKTSALLHKYFPTIDSKKAQETISLMKADLSTGMVGEFPELQGIMGSHYAKAQGVSSDIATAIREHYSPTGPQDKCPSAPLSIHAALVDKLDTLVGFFAVGLEPTASKDPYALRRTALGIIRLIHENELLVSIDDLLMAALHVYNFSTAQKEKALCLVREFIQDRLAVYFKTLYSAPLFNAVMTKNWGGSITDLDARLKALKFFLESPEGSDFITVYKRTSNLLKQVAHRDSKPFNHNLFTVEERQLFDAIKHTETSLETYLSDAPNYVKAIEALSQLKSPLEMFFANVMVQDENHECRENRLELLSKIEKACLKIADLSQL